MILPINNEIKNQTTIIINLITLVLEPTLIKLVWVVNSITNDIDTIKKKYDIIYDSSHLK